jgi:hypothetical protein
MSDDRPGNPRADEAIADGIRTLLAIPADDLTAALADPTTKRDVRVARSMPARGLRHLTLLHGPAYAVAHLDAAAAAADLDRADALHAALLGVLTATAAPPGALDPTEWPRSRAGHGA